MGKDVGSARNVSLPHEASASNQVRRTGGPRDSGASQANSGLLELANKRGRSKSAPTRTKTGPPGGTRLAPKPWLHTGQDAWCIEPGRDSESPFCVHTTPVRLAGARMAQDHVNSIQAHKANTVSTVWRWSGCRFDLMGFSLGEASF
jgi:hypothetical protein